MPLAHGAFDRGTGLAAVQHNRLVVDDGPLVQHVCVGTDSIGPAPGIEARIPQILGSYKFLGSVFRSDFRTWKPEPPRDAAAVSAQPGFAA